MTRYDRCSRRGVLLVLLLIPGASMGSLADSEGRDGDADRIRELLSSARQPWQDYDNFLQSRQALSSHGPELFGDSVNLYNGALTFSVTDISLPGNSSLPVALTRTFRVANEMDGAFGDWELDLPRIEGTYGPTWQNNRCSTPMPGTVHAGAASYSTEDYWQGLQAQMPQGGELLAADTGTPQPQTGTHWPFVTSGLTHVRCIALPAGSNTSGEGFEALAPDGSRYTFSHMAQHFEPALARPMNVGTGPGHLIRKRNAMYLTRVEDRFGHWVQYSYGNSAMAPVQLNAITSSDGRNVTLTYANGRISSATAHGRTWLYNYDSTSQSASLTRVTLPDTSHWQLALRPLADADIHYSSDEGARNCGSFGFLLGNQMAQGAVTHPSGAVGTFTIRPGRHGRSNVARVCVNWELGVNDPSNDVAYIPRETWLWQVSEKTVTGPALSPLGWTYQFGADLSWACPADNVPPALGPRFTTPACPGTLEPVCTSDSCAGKATATVSGPGGEWVRYTFGNSYRYDEGLLRKVERGTGPGNILQTETTGYQLAQSGQPYALPRGRSLRARADGFISEQPRPRTQSTTTRDGASFTWTGTQFDAFARPLSVTRSSSLGYSRTESLTYFDQTTLWVLGQLERTQVGSAIPAQTTFDPATALPTHEYGFGVLQARYTYHTAAAQRGLLSEIHDGAEVSKATLDDYKRGFPQTIARPLGSVIGAAVSDLGEIGSVYDAFGHETGYLYDGAGRLRAKEFRYADSTAWNDEQTDYTGRSAGEYGLPAGLWKRTHTRGRYEHVTWYDALWRPILTRERDATLAGSERFVRTAYDARGNVSFESYPGLLATIGISHTTLNTGISRQYDALNRPTVESRSSELGALVSSRAYLSGFQVRDTNARGKATTTRFMAYDTPSYDWPVRIDAPLSQTTVIARDVWGKPTSITRTGLYQGWQPSSVTRHFVYDAQQRLCKRVDPEHGATVMDYDSTSRLLWTADGQALPSPTVCNRESVPASQRVVRSYNARDELTGIDYPDSTDDVNFSYHPDGTLWTASVGPLGHRISHTYSYNKRRLPIQELLQVDGHDFPIGYRYSSEGALSELGYPDTSWEALNPDGLGRPRQMGQYASSIGWHRFGPLASLTYGNGLSFSQSLNARGLPSARNDSRFGLARLSETYGWDAHGNLTTISDPIGNAGAYQNASRWMSYDDLDRLTLADSAAQPPLRSPWGYSWGLATFSYDGQDNLRSFQMGAADFSYAYDSQGRLQNVSQAGEPLPLFSYTHNARGQMTSRQFQDQHFTLAWDSAHRLTSAQSWGVSGTESYRYDAHGHRVKTARSNGETVYQAYTRSGDLLWERSSTGSTRKYARVGGRLIGESVNGTRRAIHTDVIGSVRQKTDAFGTQVHEDVRAPYGSTLIGRSYQNGPAFTGHMEDGGTGLTYMKARYYDPVAMRFLSPDPVYVDLGTGGNFNRYWYANNNPYTYVDPDGRQANSPNDCNSANTRLCPILGRAQSTGSADHAPAGVADANRMAASGEYKSVHLNQSLSTVTGDPAAGRQRPDVAGVRIDTGGVDTIEHPSPSQSIVSQDTKGAEMQRRLGEVGRSGRHQTRTTGQALRSISSKLGAAGAVITVGFGAAELAQDPTQERARSITGEIVSEALCGVMGGCGEAHAPDR